MSDPITLRHVGCTRRRRFSAILVLLLGVLTAVAASAQAKESKPLNVTRFTLEPTEAVRVGGPLTHTNWGYENRPIAFTQAGGHPDSLTATIDFETEEVYASRLKNGTHYYTPTRDPKDVVVTLPPGLIGDPLAVPRCPLKRALITENPCPPATQIGIAKVYFNQGNAYIGPIVNVIPEAGQSAEFVIEVEAKISTILTAHLARIRGATSNPPEYGFTVASNGILGVGVYSVEATFWGVPADPVHDPQRGLFCSVKVEESSSWGCGLPFSTISGLGGEKAGIEPVPLLTWPSDCAAGPEKALLRADSWEEPGHYVSAETTIPAATGCNLLEFGAGTGIALEPEVANADVPDGVGVSLKVPLNETPKLNAAPELRDTVVTLPQGMSISPAAVNGIQACEEHGPEGIDIEGPESEAPGLNGELQLAPGHCPEASVVGTAEAITPFLPKPVDGRIYLARPGCGNASFGQMPCTERDALDGNLYRMYLELGGKGSLANEGIVFKVPFDVEVNPATGQVTTNVRDLVQAPYSEVRVRLNGGARAPVANPPTCGAATTTADLTPWSASGVTPEGLMVNGTPDLLTSSFFDTGGCVSPPVLVPGFVAGTVTPNAAKFSAFTMDISRKDGEQYIRGVRLHTPPGLLARLAGVALCPDAQADAPARFGECPDSSKVGTARVASGAGEEPYEVEGEIYLTGPYRGAPFGLSIVTHAVAGPFDLGLVVVRARIDIDPHDANAIVTTDETGPYALPQILFGIPLRLQHITVNVDRPSFMVNPTNCSAMHITAVVSGSQQAVAQVSSPFAVGGCKSLAFKPQFTAKTNAHTSRARGASLDVNLTYPKGAMGSEANIARVKVSLPKQLPSYLPTLQKACTVGTFERNPAECPGRSKVGIARASTPLLAGELEGPVYFVSHGGEEFPSLIIVLEGDGVRVDLVGSTYINEKTGVTSSTFKTVPDVPVQSFELYLPQGPNHALAANVNLCHTTSVEAVQRSLTRRIGGRAVRYRANLRKRIPGLLMPTEFVAQNGAVIRRQTNIAVTGCGAKHPLNARRRQHHGVLGRKGK